MTVIGTAFIAVKPDMTGFGKAVGAGVSGAGGKAEKAGKQTGSKFSGAFKGAATLGGVAAVAGVAAFGKSSVAAARESEVAQARLGNVFKSMGDKTGSATDAAIKYAGALQKSTAIDDETIMAAQTKIATFGKVSDTTARQAGIFDRATGAAADLAAAGFGSMESNATSLGKALQDPEKGITALARSGVTFTKQEKEKIKTLMESGRQTEAQRMVLGAIEKQVGGTAAATATASDKMKNSWGEAQEQVGSALLPVLEKVQRVVTNDIIPAFTKLVSFLSSHANIIGPIAGGILGVAAAIKLVNVSQKAWNAATKAWGTLQKAGSKAQDLWNARQKVWAAVTKIGTIVQAAFNAVMAVNPIVLIVVALVALVAAIIIAYKKVGWFHDAVDALWQGVQVAFDFIIGAAKAVLDWLKSNWQTVLAIITGPLGLLVLVITKNWDTIKNAVMAAVNWIIGFVKAGFSLIARVVAAVWNGIKTATLAVWNGVKAALGAVLSGIRTAIVTYFNVYRAIILGIWNGIKAVTSAVWNGIKATIRGVVAAIRAVITTAWNGLKAITSGVFNTIKTVVSNAFNGIKNVARGAIDFVTGLFRSLGSKITGFAGTVGRAALGVGKALVKGLVDGVKGVVGAAADFGSAVADAVKKVMNGIIRTLNNLFEFTLTGPGPLPDLHVNLPDIPTFAKGGFVPGRRGAPALAVVHGGEFVSSLDQVAAGRGGAAVGGPAVAIASATFNEPVDVDLLIGRVGLAIRAGRL